MSLACTLNGPTRLSVEQYPGAFRADVRPRIRAQLPISQSRAAFDLALDRGRSTKVQLIPG